MTTTQKPQLIQEFERRTGVEIIDWVADVAGNYGCTTSWDQQITIGADGNMVGWNDGFCKLVW